jgi:CPA2 family monovalent cation:H+ antiporter-2
LLTQASRNDAVDRAWSEPLIAAIAISLALAPVLISQSGAIAGRLGALVGTPADAPELGTDKNDIANHVILCGCGRLGRLVANVLDTAGIRYVALESDLGRYQAAKRAGARVVYGDAGRARALEAAGFETADLIVLTFDRGPALTKVLERARHRRPALASVVSAADDRDMAHLVELGAGTVFPENLAAGLALADQILVQQGKTKDEAARIITQVRGALNPELGDRVGL